MDWVLFVFFDYLILKVFFFGYHACGRSVCGGRE